MTTYTYDLTELEETAGAVRQLASSFEQASAVRRGADGALGYDALRDAVRAFTDNWSHHRDKQLAALHSASTTLTKVCAGYRALDDGAASQLHGH